MFLEIGIIDILGLVSFIAGFVAIFYWIKIYNELKKGSLAWLLLTVTSIFMITTPIYIYFFSGGYLSLELIVLALMFWGAIYVSFFAGAGHMLYRTFVRVPRGSVGKYLIEGFRFDGTTTIGKGSKEDFLLPEILAKDEEGSKSKEEQNSDIIDENHLLSNENESNNYDVQPHTIKRYTDFPGNISLVQYNSIERYEDAVIEIALEHIEKERNVVLFTSTPKLQAYKKAFKLQRDSGVIKIVDFVEDKGKQSQDEGIITLQMDQSNYFLDILKDFPKRCMLLIEYPFISSKKNDRFNIEFLTKIIEKAMENEIGVVAFFDINGQSESEKNHIMDLFMSQALITNDKITLLKGKKKGFEIPVLNHVDYVKYTLR